VVATLSVPVRRRRGRRCSAHRQQRAGTGGQDHCCRPHQGLSPHSSRDLPHSSHLIPSLLATAS